MQSRFWVHARHFFLAKGNIRVDDGIDWINLSIFLQKFLLEHVGLLSGFFDDKKAFKNTLCTSFLLAFAKETS